MKQALNPSWTDEQRYLSDASKTIVMSPTFFPRCDAFKVAYKSEGAKFPVGEHDGKGPCLCPDKIGEQHKLGHEILQNSCFTCCHGSAIEYQILHAATHIQMLKNHTAAFRQQKDEFNKGRPSSWTAKFFYIVETRVESFRELQVAQNDRHNYFCDYCSFPLGYPEQWFNYAERMSDGVCSCYDKWFETALDKHIGVAIPQMVSSHKGIAQLCETLHQREE